MHSYRPSNKLLIPLVSFIFFLSSGRGNISGDSSCSQSHLCRILFCNSNGKAQYLSDSSQIDNSACFSSLLQTEIAIEAGVQSLLNLTIPPGVEVSSATTDSMFLVSALISVDPVSECNRIEPTNQIISSYNKSVSISLTAYTAGRFQLAVGQAFSGGLWGSYFTNHHFDGQPVLNRIDEKVDFQDNYFILQTDSLLSIRWCGFIRTPLFLDSPNISETYTFSLRLASMGDSASLVLDDKVLIDFSSTQAGTVVLSSGTMYRLLLLYKMPRIGSGSISLIWSSSSIPPQPVSPANLFWVKPFSEPVSIRVLPGRPNNFDILLFSSVSIATAGQQSTFSVVFTDRYGNYEKKISANFQPLATLRSEIGTLTPDLTKSLAYASDTSSFNGILTATKSGYFQLFIGYGSFGVLSTTFYDVPSASLSNQTILSSGFWNVETGYTRQSIVMQNFSTSTAVSVGYLKRTISDSEISIISTVFASDCRVKLWVDSYLIIDQWSSLSTIDPSGYFTFGNEEYHSFVLQYRSNSSLNSPNLAIKSVVMPLKPIIMKQALLSSNLFQPMPILVVADGPFEGETFVTAASIATAGMLSSFSISLRDRFGNPSLPLFDELCGNNIFTATFRQSQFIFRASLSHPISTVIGDALLNGDFGTTSTGFGILASFMNGIHIRGSPLFIQVVSGSVSGPDTAAMGSGLTLATAGSIATFLISQRDKYGNRGMPTLQGLRVDILSFDPDALATSNFMSMSSAEGIALSYLITRAARYSLLVIQDGNHIMGSPFTINVVSASTCSVTSYASGAALSVSTAGISAVFRIEIQDGFGNSRESNSLSNEFSFFRMLQSSQVVIEGRSMLSTDGVQLDSKNSTSFFAQYILTSAGNYNVQIFLAQHGLVATYYSNGSLSPNSALSSINTDFGIIHSLPAQLGFPHSGNEFLVGARWVGFLDVNNLLPLFARIITNLGDSTGRIRLWIENTLVLEQWTSLSTQIPSSTFYFVRGTGFYEVQIEYQNLASNLSSHNGFIMSWQNATLPPNNENTTISLISAYKISTGFNCLVVSSEICSATSYAVGGSLSLSTAGVPVSFRIFVRDRFGNSYGTDNFFLMGSDDDENQTALISQSDSKQYILTASGNFSMSVKLLVPGGLRATFYADTYFQVPIYNSLSLGSLASLQDPGFAPIFSVQSEYFSIRWSGFLQINSSGLYTFYSSDEQSIRLILDSILVLDSSTQGRSSSNSVVSLSASKNSGIHKLILEFQHATGRPCSGLGVQWKPPWSCTRSPVPSSALIFDENILGSPFRTTVRPGPGVATTSTIKGRSCTVLTVGIVSTFLIYSRDEFGNPLAAARTSCCQANCSQIPPVLNSAVVVKLRPLFSSVRSSQLSQSYGGFGQWDVLAQGITLAGKYNLQVLFPCAGGLRAYYAGNEIQTSGSSDINIIGTRFLDFRDKFLFFKTTIDAGISLNTSCSNLASEDFLQSVSVVWTGLLYVPCQSCGVIDTMTYSLRVDLSSPSDRVKLWVENTLVIDQWSSFVSFSPNGVFQFDATREFWTIDLWYTHPNCSESVSIRLLWNSSTFPVPGYVAVPTAHLFTTTSIGEGTNMTETTVLPDYSSVTYYYSRGSELTIATAGQLSSFVLFPMDQYGNMLQYSEVLINTVRRNLNSKFYLSIGTIIRPSMGISNSGYVEYTMTVSGLYSVDVFAILMGAIQATYYRSDNLSGALSYSVERFSESKFNLTLPFNSRAARYSAVFESGGFFNFSIGNSGDRVKIWIDGELLIDQWSSLSRFNFGSFYVANSTFAELAIEYKSATPTGPPSFLTLSSSRVFATVTLSNMLAPIQLQILPNSACTSTSYAFGQPISLATVGILSSFTIQAMDEYYNLCTNSANSYIISVWTSLQARIAVFGQFGEVLGLYLTTKAGPASLHVDSASSGGLTGEYFDVSSFDDAPALVIETDDSLISTIRRPWNQKYSGLRWSGFVQADSRAGVGLQATYYSDSSLSPSTAAKAIGLIGTDSIDFSSAGTIAIDTSLESTSRYGIRWSGFIRPSRLGLHTFYVKLFGVSDTVRIWIDDQVVLDGPGRYRDTNSNVTNYFTTNGSNYSFSRAASFYKILIEYRHFLTNLSTTRAQGLVVAWDAGSGIQRIGPEYLFPADVSEDFVSHTFYISGGGGSRLWVGGFLVLDSWESPACIPSDPVFLAAGTLHEIRVEYRRLQDLQELPSLSWISDLSQQRISVPEGQLWSLLLSRGRLAGSPYLLHVNAGKMSPVTSDFFAISSEYQIIVDQEFRIAIRPKDAFGNILETVGSLGEVLLIILRHGPTSYFSSYLNTYVNTTHRNVNSRVNCTDGGLCISSVTSVIAGLHSVSANFLTRGVLSVTYFADSTFKQPIEPLLVASQVNTSMAFVKFYGFLKAPADSLFTFFIGLRPTSERLLLWIDNVVIIDSWNMLSANDRNGSIALQKDTYYEIQILYQGVFGMNISGSNTRLTWSFNGSGKQSINSSALFSADQIGDPMYIGVFSNTPQVSDHKCIRYAIRSLLKRCCRALRCVTDGVSAYRSRK